MEKIVADISKKLEDVSDLTDLDGFVGLTSWIEELKSLPCLELHDVRIIGIWGMGGIGKITIASVVSTRFLETFKASASWETLEKNQTKRSSTCSGWGYFWGVRRKSQNRYFYLYPQESRKRSKVLIVLDDVHD